MYERIAILKPSALGDIVHALPVLTALRQRFPDSHISWVVNRSFAPLLEHHPHLDRVIAFDRGAFRNATNALRYSLQLANELRGYHFDCVLDLQGLLRTGLMSLMTGAPRKIGFANAREGSAYAYTHRVAVPDADRIHAVNRYWRMAEFVGAGDRPKQFVLPINPQEADAVAELLAAYPRPWLCVAAGAKWVTKRWPPESFATLLQRFQSQYGGTAILVGSADDIALSAAIADRLRGSTLDLTGKTSLPRLAAVLAAADAMLANDTGPLHLAAALGKPCVAPYTCTKIVRHGPYGSMAGAVETTVPCAGSYLKQCPRGTICFGELTPNRLWPALEEALRK